MIPVQLVKHSIFQSLCPAPPTFLFLKEDKFQIQKKYIILTCFWGPVSSLTAGGKVALVVYLLSPQPPLPLPGSKNPPSFSHPSIKKTSFSHLSKNPPSFSHPSLRKTSFSHPPFKNPPSFSHPSLKNSFSLLSIPN